MIEIVGSVVTDAPGVGASDGCVDMKSDGSLVITFSIILGVVDGDLLGELEGDPLGEVLGETDGELDGLEVGEALGFELGDADGTADPDGPVLGVRLG